MSSENHRDALIAKIRALRAKTEAAGCSEGEAMAAAELAARLISRWEIDEAMEREYSTYAKAHAGRLGRGAKASFQIGMAARINARLRSMIRNRDAVMRTGDEPGRADRFRRP